MSNGPVHVRLYEQAMEQLEEIVDEDPDYESDEESDFMAEMTDSGHASLTTDQVEMIRRIHRRYVGKS